MMPCMIRSCVAFLLVAAATGAVDLPTPTVLPAGTVPTEAQRRALDEEQSAVRDWISRLIREDSGVPLLIEKLDAACPRFAGHPAHGYLLVALGDALRQSDPARAQAVYEQAGTCTPSDQWSFAQQMAWQQLADLRERRGDYRGALAALARWQVGEPCGTGMRYTYQRRSLWIYRLRLAAGDQATLDDL